MRIKKGVSSVQVGISIVVILLIVGAGGYYFLTLPPNVITTTQTVTQTTGSTVTSTTASTVTVAPTTTTAAAPTLQIQRNSAYSDADPRDTSSIDMAQQSYETLTYIAPNGTVTPGLATSWSQIGNGSTWEFNLRQGVTFHDGTTFNATDVQFSINNIVKWGGGDAPIVWDLLKSISIKSAYVIDITFSAPVFMPQVVGAAYSAFIFSHNILNYAGGVNDTSGLHAWFNGYHDDGSGPYVHNATASSLSKGQWVLNQYPKYWGGWKAGQVTTQVYTLVTNVNTAIQLAQQGQFDVIGVGGNYQFVPQLLGAGLNVVAGQGGASIWLLMNTKHPYLNSSLVRQALLTAVNYQQILAQTYYNYGSLVNGMIYPSHLFYDPSAPGFPQTGNLTAAKALLVKAGYSSGALPGVTFTLTHSTGSPFEATIGQLLNTYWQPLGATVNIQGLSFTNQAIKAGYYNPTTKSAFIPGPISYANATGCASTAPTYSCPQDLALLNWSGATADPWLVPAELLAIQNAPYQNNILYNWTYWTNSTFSNLLNKARIDEGTNPTLAAQEFKTLNLMFYQSAPAAIMFSEQQIWVVSPHWKGVVMNPYYGFDYFFFYQWTYKP